MRNFFFTKTLYGRLLKQAWDFCPVKRWRFFLIYGMFLCSNLILLIEPLLFGRVINTIQQGGPDMLSNLLQTLLLFILIELVFWGIHGPARVIERQISFDVSKNFQSKLFAGLLNLPLKWHNDHHSGRIISREKKAVEALRDFTAGQFMYIDTFIKFVAIGIVFFVYVPQYAILAIVASIFLFLVTYKFDRWYAQSLKAMNEKIHHMDAGFIDFIGNAITLITLRVQKLATNEYQKRVQDTWPPFRRLIRLNEWKWFVVSLGVSFIYVIVLYPYAYSLSSGGEILLLGGFVSLMEYTRRYNNVFYSFADKYERLVRNKTNLEAITSIWSDIQSQSVQALSVKKQKWTHLQIADLHFKHDASTDAHDLYDLGFVCKKGEKIALIGESGSGKSTLLRVIRGLFVPERINVSFEKDSQKNKNYDWLKQHTTLIPQDPEIFENTIRFNITLGVTISDKEIDEVVRLARFDSVLKRLPDGYNTDIRERGVNLSGGEKQRLALARGLLAAKQSEIILLDEPTSSVDMTNEKEIFTDLFAAWPNKTFIVSVHRKYLLDMFDTVYEMTDGRMK
jgi:ATP-binding cassette subfamily B protein